MVDSRLVYAEIKGLLHGAGVEDAGLEADLLIRHVTGHSRLLREAVDEDDRALLMEMATRRAKHEPLQYILGSWPFLGIKLFVGPGVLVPRPETEEVCVAAAAFVAHMLQPVVLDLCSGTGALALGLQSFMPAARITAVELDEAAMDYLKHNCDAFFLGKSYEHPPRGEDEERSRVPHAALADVLAWHKTLGDASVDLIVSNPPYVSEAEYETLAPEVHAEPRMALVAGEDGLAFYRAIARDYRRVLKPGGALVFEIGHTQGAAVRGILEQNGYAAPEIRQDLAGCDRIAIGLAPQAAV